MNRIPRRGRVPPVPRHNDSLNRFKQGVRTKVSSGIEVLHAPHARVKVPLRKSRSKERNVANRCCYVSPEKKNFGQYYAGDCKSGSKDTATGPERPIDHDQRHFSSGLLKSLNDFKPGISAKPHLQESKKLSRHSRNKVKTSPKCASSRSCNTPMFSDVFDESHWQKLDSPEDIDTIIKSQDFSGFNLTPHPKQIFISDVPRVKVIAEKFSKYKRGNLELRRLEEKVVCVEYDIFNQPYNHEVLKPVQRMRAFFSIKPSFDNDSSGKQGLPRLPSNIKNEFEVVEEDLEKLTEKEIEFIDNEIEENQSYLEDLRRILKRKEVLNAHKNKTSLDLQCLYDMARRDGRPLNSDFSETNLLSKAKLQEVKQLILQRCTSSIHGFRRKTIKKNGSTLDPGATSEGIMSEMLQYKT